MTLIRALSGSGGGGTPLDVQFTNDSSTSLNTLPVRTWRDTGVSASSVKGALFYYPTSVKYQAFAYIDNGEIKAKFTYWMDIKVENGNIWVYQEATSSSQNFVMITYT